mgnify:CR=1 FL=1
MGRAALFVDIDSIRVGVDDIGTQLREAVKQPRGSGRGRSVGTVYKDTQATQGGVYSALQVVDVVL